ncbi:MAG: hypothetical protein Q9182_000094 [Xanthomendoza sp. 2 TL-2023]
MSTASVIGRPSTLPILAIFISGAFYLRLRIKTKAAKRDALARRGDEVNYEVKTQRSGKFSLILSWGAGTKGELKMEYNKKGE